MSVTLSESTTRQFEEASSTRAAGGASPQWLLYYYAVQIVCQLALLSSWFASGRVFFRVSAFGTSLVALAFTSGQRPSLRHPAARLGILVLAILAVEAFHPLTVSALGALATIAMYLAILGPIFWVPRLNLDLSWFRRVVLVIWAFQFLSALVGALQVYYPGVFQPAVATLLSDAYLSSLKVTLSNGERILRPSGLTDAPGGAAGAGTITILLALGLWTQRPRRLLKGLLAVSIGVGMFVLYMCQIRSLVVMTGISILAMAAVQAMSGRFRNFVLLSLIVTSLAALAFAAAASVGGEDVTRRLATLVASSPGEVYYTNRGIFLEHTLSELLPEYPLGAGLLRWGMLLGYFGGGRTDWIYVEIQWTGWLLDGGILLMLTYALMLGVTLWSAAKIAFRSGREANDVSGWAAMLVGYDVGTIALTFNFPVFMSAFGLDFWLLNTALLVVAERSTRPTSLSPQGVRMHRTRTA